MREALISILALLTVAPFAKTSEIGKDGFNLYKAKKKIGIIQYWVELDDVFIIPIFNYFRARSDDADSPGSVERMLYLFPAPLLYPGLPAAVEQEYRKRTGNAFKNHLLSKEFWADDAGDGLGKRSSRTAISLIMQGKHPYDTDEGHYCPYGKRG